MSDLSRWLQTYQSTSDDYTGPSIAPPINLFGLETKMQPGSFQLNLFDRSEEPTLLEFLRGSCAILTTERWAELRLQQRYLNIDTSLGLPTRTGLMGYLSGVALYPMRHLLHLIDT